MAVGLTAIETADSVSPTGWVELKRYPSCKLKTGLHRGIPLWPSSPATKLLQENGRLACAIMEKDGKLFQAGATLGPAMTFGYICA